MRITPLPPLPCLIAFEASVRHASFTKAAHELHLTQSAVSRQVQQLEEFLGRALFVREHRALRLTIAGERYARHIQQVLTQCAEATHDVMKRAGDQELTVACSSGVAVLWLTPRLGAFRRAFPGIKIRMIVRDGLGSMSPAEFDVGLYFVRQPDTTHFTMRHVFEEEVFPVCAPDYLQGRLLRPAEIAQQHLLMQEDGQRQWMSWREWLGFHDVTVPPRPSMITMNHYPQLLQMAILGEGLVLGWRYMIDACLEQGLLVRATRESASLSGGYYVVSPNDRALHQAARLFEQWLLDQTAEQRAAGNKDTTLLNQAAS